MLKAPIWDWKVKNLKKSHLRLLLNLHTKFYLASLIWKGLMWGINLENKRNRPKNYIVRGEKLTPVWPLISQHIKFQFPSSIWRRDEKGRAFFQCWIKLRGWFLDILPNFSFHIDLTLQHPLFWIWAQLNFDPKSSPF